MVRAEAGDGVRAGNDSAVIRIMLGTRLRRMRETAGVTPGQAAHKIRGSTSKISRMERGQHRFKELDVDDLLTLYGVADRTERLQILGLVRRANEPGWWQSYSDVLPTWFQAYVGLEESAWRIRTYESQLIPGLLQTEDYAAAVIAIEHRDSAELKRRVALRTSRQRGLYNGDLRLWATIDEAALRRKVGGAPVIQGQLAHLLAAVQLPNVTIQVAPFSAGALATQGAAFSVLRFADAELPDVVYVEQLTGAAYLDKRDEVDHYVEAMDRVAAASAPPEESEHLIATILREMEGAR